MEAELQGVSRAVYQQQGWATAADGGHGGQHAGVGKGEAALEESELLAAILMEELAI
jgi:hypothetical protein